ncbi:hypothetical protein FO519_010334, partial [Halicephalobus sp. NKZ332]
PPVAPPSTADSSSKKTDNNVHASPPFMPVAGKTNLPVMFPPAKMGQADPATTGPTQGMQSSQQSSNPPN